MGHQFEALATRQQFSHRSTNLAAGLHLLLGQAGRVATASTSVTAQLTADGRRGSVDQAGNPAQAEALGTTDLNGGALFNAEFGIRHRGSTVPERSGVALSFCRRPLIAFAQPFPLGDPVLLNRKQLLRKIKRGAIGSSQYEWLYRSMKRLREATLFLEALKPDGSTRYTVGRMESFNILKSLSYDSETYRYTLDPHWILMFGNREYSLIDWEKRLQIRRGLDMAKTLQRLIATSSDRVQRYALERLRAQMAYGGRLRDFRDSLGRAVCELERLEIIARGCIQESSRGNQQLVLWLTP